MNLSMRLTLDGLLRALRWRAHGAAEDIATVRREAADTVRPALRRPPALKEGSDVRSRR